MRERKEREKEREREREKERRGMIHDEFVTGVRGLHQTFLCCVG